MNPGCGCCLEASPWRCGDDLGFGALLKDSSAVLDSEDLDFDSDLDLECEDLPLDPDFALDSADLGFLSDFDLASDRGGSELLEPITLASDPDRDLDEVLWDV